MMKLLIDKEEVKDKEGWTPAQLAVQKGYTEMLKVVIYTL